VDYPSGGDTAREKFEILVYAEEKLQKLEQYSGGEGWRVSLAILFALRDVLVLKSDCSLPLLLIDDPVGPVDPIGLTNLFSTLQGLVDNGSAPTILVTLPSESDATTGNLIRLQRKNGMTEVL
jgi:DNA repair exonuclease SbcCD ATPase subunit